MKILLLCLLATLTGCSTPATAKEKEPEQTAKAVASSKKDTAIRPKKIDKVSPRSVTKETFVLKPADAKIMNGEEALLSINGYGRKRGNEYGGKLFVPHGRRIPYKAYSSTGTGKPDKLVIDWNMNKDYSDDPVLMSPDEKTAPIQTMKINGIQYKLKISRVGTTGYNIRIHNAQWYVGKLALNGKVYDATIVDVNMNGIDDTGTDRLLLDLKGYKKGVSLTKKLLLRGGFYNVKIDLDQVSLSPVKNFGTISLSQILGKEITKISGHVMSGRKKHRFESKGTSLKLNPGKYDTIDLEVEMRGENKAVDRITIKTFPLEIKANETLTLKIGKPDIALTLEQKGDTLNVEPLLSEKFTKGVISDFTVYSNGKKAPAPKILIYKGNDVLAKGSMKYG